MAVADWDNVLVLQTSFIGDLVLTLPLIAEIRRRFPNARLTTRQNQLINQGNGKVTLIMVVKLVEPSYFDKLFTILLLYHILDERERDLGVFVGYFG